MSYIGMQTYSLGIHLTCWESTPALSALSSPSVPRPNRYHRRRGRWEKNDAKWLENSGQAPQSQLHQRSQVFHLARQCRLGQKGQQQMADLHQLHQSK